MFLEKGKLCLGTSIENELQRQCIVRTDFMLLKAAGLCGKEINASEIMKHKASEVKELFHSGRKKTKPITNGFKMSLSCVYDKWRIKQIGWVGSLGRDKMAEYSDPPFFLQGSQQGRCLSASVGWWVRRSLVQKPGRACCKQTSCSDSSAGSG